MIFGVTSATRRLEKFAEPAVFLTRAQMTSLIKTTPMEFMRVWTTKLNGQGMRRMMRTGPFPGGPKGPVYDYEARGYWVMYDQNKRDWRTIVLNNVTKVKLGNQVYKVR
jgi:hypothetical protein